MLAVSFSFEVLRFRLLQKYYSMPGRLKTSKISKFPHKRLYLVGCVCLGNLKTDRLLWFYVRSKTSKPQKYADSLIKCRILLGCCRLGNLKTERLLWFYVRSKTSKSQKMKNCCELLSKLRQSLDLKNFKTIRLMWPQLQTKT